MKHSDLFDLKDEQYESDFNALMNDYRLVRKRNRQTKVLSVIAIILSITGLIIRILMAQ